MPRAAALPKNGVLRLHITGHEVWLRNLPFARNRRDIKPTKLSCPEREQCANY